MSRPCLPRKAKNLDQYRCGTEDQTKPEYSVAQKCMIAAKGVIPITELEGYNSDETSLLLVHAKDTKVIKAIQSRMHEFKYGSKTFKASLKHQPLCPSEDVRWESCALTVKTRRLISDVTDRYIATGRGLECNCCSACMKTVTQEDGTSQLVRKCGADCLCASAKIECYHAESCCNTAIRDGTFPALMLCSQSYMSDPPIEDIGVRTLEPIAKNSIVCLWASRIYHKNKSSKQQSTSAFEICLPDWKKDSFICEVIPYGNVAHFINDPGPSRELLNVELVVFQALNDVFPVLVAKKDIKEHSYLYLSYGKNYFKEWDIIPLAPINNKELILIGQPLENLADISDQDLDVSLSPEENIVPVPSLQSVKVDTFGMRHFLSSRHLDFTPVQARRFTRAEWNNAINYNESERLDTWTWKKKEAIVLVLESWAAFKADLDSSSPIMRPDLGISMEIKHDSSEPLKLDALSLFPRPVDVMTAVWNWESKEYQPFVRRNAFVLIGWIADSNGSLLPVSLECTITPLPNEIMPTEFTCIPITDQRNRYLRALDQENWFRFDNICIMALPPSVQSLERSGRPQQPPRPPQLLLLPSLLKLMSIDEGHEAVRFFKWKHTLEALELSSATGEETFRISGKLAYDEWIPKIINILGKDDYGKVTVHNVIMVSINTILDDLNKHSNQNKLSEDQKELVWLEEPCPIATFAWDVCQDAYRVHLKRNARVLLECRSDQSGSYNLPQSIRFLTCNTTTTAEDEYHHIVSTIHDFKTEQEEWRLKTRYIY